MEIISHRGYWKTLDEKNSITALYRSFRLGYGTETDLRDLNGELVISHDPPLASDTLVGFDDFLKLLNSISPTLPIALNIKSDGIHKLAKDILDKFPEISNYYFFDMSVPDTINYRNLNLPFFTRLSEYETVLAFEEDAEGVWLDGFNSVWYKPESIHALLGGGKKVFIVSEDLHGRNRVPHWQLLKDWGISNCDNVFLCTDYPEEATEFFKV